MVEWPEGTKNPIGKVVDILGRTGENNAEMHAILAEFGLPYTYPKNVEAIADRIPKEIPQQEIDRRRDMRREELRARDLVHGNGEGDGAL